MSSTGTLSLHGSPGGLIEGALLPDGALALRWPEAAGATWVRLAGPHFVAAPAILTDRAGQLWVFALDAAGAVHANVRRDDLGWSGFQELRGGKITDGVSACLDSGGRVVVFGRGTDGAVYHRWLDGTSWSDWHPLGGVIQHAPAAVLTAEGRLTVFGMGADGALWHRFYAGGWSDWSSLGGGLTAAPAAVIDGVGTLRVFGRGTDNALWTRHYDLQWQPWTSLGGGLAGAPAAATDRSGRLHVRVVGTDQVTIHERTAVTAWEDYAAVDRLPLDVVDPAALDEQRRLQREEMKKNPAVQRAAQIIVDGLRAMHARGIAAARDPGRFTALDEFERGVAKRFARRSPEVQERLAKLSQVELTRFEELRATQPDLWGRVDLTAAAPLTEQLRVTLRESPALVQKSPGAAIGGPKIVIRPRAKPQGGGAMQFRIQSIYCAEETDEVGDDTITMSGFTRAPSGQAIAFGPHELGDFSDTDGPDERARHFDVTDSRANFRWAAAGLGSADDPYLLSLTLVEVDGDLDDDFMTGITRLVDIVSGVLAATGPWGVVAAAAIQLAWAGISAWWKEKMEDEIAPALIFEGWAGMPDANTPRKTWMEWDGGRYELTYSWSPPDLFTSFDLDKLPPVAPQMEKEFVLLDQGPFTHIGATTASGRFGLWARKPDGRILFRDTPRGAWVEIAGALATWVDDGWALVEGTAGRFERAESAYKTLISRAADSFSHILRFSRVAGSSGALAWGIAEGKPFIEAPSRPANPKQPLGGLAQLAYQWNPVPSDATLTEIVVAPGDPSGRVWALDGNGTPYQYTGSFVARPASFPLASVCVPDALEAFGISRGGQTYLWSSASATWGGYLCYELRNGSKVPLVARQMRYTGQFDARLSRHYLLTATGRLYVADGSRMA